MAQHTTQQLAAMARTALQHRAAESSPWALLVLRLNLEHGYTPDQTLANLQRLAGATP